MKTKRNRGILFLAINLTGALTMGREVIIRLVAKESDNWPLILQGLYGAELQSESAQTSFESLVSVSGFNKYQAALVDIAHIR